MKWPHREDWSAHLIHWCNDHPSVTATVGPRGGFVVPGSGNEHVTCPTCGDVTVWPPATEVHCAPPGHYLIRDDDDRVVEDICPEA